MHLNARPHRAGGKFSGERDEILPGVGGTRGNIDKRGDLGVDPRLAYDGAAPGVSDQHGRAILKRQCAARRGDGIVQRRQRILHGGNFQAGGLKQRDDFGPAGAVRPRPMYQHHVARFGRRGRLGVRFKFPERCRECSDGKCDNDPSYLHRINSVTIFSAGAGRSLSVFGQTSRNVTGITAL